MRTKQTTFFLLLSCMIFSSLTTGQVDDKIFLQDFKTQDFKKDGSTAWKMHGKNAKLSGGKVLLRETSTALFTPKGEVLITTGNSVFNQTSKVWNSNDPVKIRGINLHVSGIGFVMNTTERKIHINKKVKATLNPIKKLRSNNENK